MFTPTRRPRRARLVGAVILAGVLGVGIARAGIYPNPAHDFGPVAGAEAFYNAASGANPRPLLVVMVTFSDVTTPSDFTAANTAQRVFGPNFPNLAGYYSANSFGKMTFTPAQESCGTANDGVVVVDVGSSTTWLGLGEAGQNRADLDAVDALGCANFATFDRNNDGTLTRDEVDFLEITALARGCGATRKVTSGNSLNGKTIPSNDGNRMSKSDSNTDIVTLTHEVGHQAFGARDLYGWGVGSFDLFGPTCNYSDTTMFEFNAWQKLHLGWIMPTVVSSDGFYDVRRADTTGDAFILYDPSKGTNDYFIVENRAQASGTYDQNASDHGLVIWRADDSQYTSSTNRAIEIMRPDGSTIQDGGGYGGSSIDAWDPSDVNTLERTMARTWRDGSASNVAVRAIGDAGDVMRVYFDVRGPGVLVDTYDRLKQGPVFVTLGETGTLSFPVRNTGEASDTFAFTAAVPGGWTTSPDNQTLGAGVGSTANVQVKPPLNATTGLYTLTVTGRSVNDSSITSSNTVQVFVLRRPTTLVYNGSLTADYHDPAQLSATLTDTISGLPLSSQPVGFTLGTQTANATTDGSGVASTSVVVDQTPGSVSVSADFAGDATYLPSTASSAFTITREETTTSYVGPTVILQGASGVTLKAQLLEDGTTAPVPFGQTLTLSLGGQSCTGTVDSTGLATCSLTFSGALGQQPLEADFAGDTYYLPSSDTSKTAIVFAFPSRGAFVLGNTTVAGAGPTTTVSWWGAGWSSANALSGGPGPSAFKGFAETVASLPTSTPPSSCSGSWTTTGGNSPPPTEQVPSYMGVLVASAVGKSGNTIAGNFAKIVVVKTDPGYDSSPGQAGRGKIVATFCP